MVCLDIGKPWDSNLGPRRQKASNVPLSHHRDKLARLVSGTNGIAHTETGLFGPTISVVYVLLFDYSCLATYYPLNDSIALQVVSRRTHGAQMSTWAPFGLATTSLPPTAASSP